MNKPYPFSEINSALASVKSVGILLPENPDYDLVAASLGLFLSLEKTGKSMTIASPSLMTVGFSYLVGLNKVVNKISPKGDITLSIDYPLGNLEKVTLPDNTPNVNLIFKLKNGAPAMPTDKINFSQPGQTIELYFFIGGENLASFEKLIVPAEAQNYNSIAIHRQQTAAGKIKVTDSDASSYSEMITAILVSLSLPSNQDIAQNLFLGLNEATANFTSQAASADTFEAAALCLRAGAKKQVTDSIPPQKIKEEKVSLKAPSPDWLQPKIYRGTGLI